MFGIIDIKPQSDITYSVVASKFASYQFFPLYLAVPFLRASSLFLLGIQ